MKELINFLSTDKTVWFSTLASLVILFIIILLILLFYRNLPPLIPVFNQLPWGTDRLIAKIGLLLPVFASICIFVINVFITRSGYEKMPITARMLNITTLLVIFLTLFFVFRTIQLII